MKHPKPKPPTRKQVEAVAIAIYEADCGPSAWRKYASDETRRVCTKQARAAIAAYRAAGGKP